MKVIGSLLNHIQLFALAIAMTVTPLIAPAQTPNAKSLAIKAQDLLPFSQKCQDTYRRPPICENRSTILKSRLVGAATDLQSIKEGIVREDFQEKLMNVYYQKAYQNMADRYAAIVSMSGKDFIQDSPRDFESYLKVAKCAKASSLEQSKMNFKERLKNARSADPFNLKGLAKEDLAILKDLELKKFVLATIALRGEMTKIKATGSKEDLPAMKEFLMPDPGRVAIDPRAIENVFKILEHYPLLTMDENHLTRLESQFAKVLAEPITHADRRGIGKIKNMILFPRTMDSDIIIDLDPQKEIGLDEVTPIGCNDGESKGLRVTRECDYSNKFLNLVRKKQLNAKDRETIGKAMFESWKNQMLNLNKICDLNHCQLIGMSPAQTAEAINSLNPRNQSSVLRQVCQCSLQTRTELIDASTKENLSYAVLGTAIVAAFLCPVSLGTTCSVAVATGAALLGGTTALETFSDYQKTKLVDVLNAHSKLDPDHKSHQSGLEIRAEALKSVQDEIVPLFC